MVDVCDFVFVVCVWCEVVSDFDYVVVVEVEIGYGVVVFWLCWFFFE